MTVGNGKCNTGNPLKLQRAISVHLFSNDVFMYEYVAPVYLKCDMLSKYSYDFYFKY